MIILMKIISFAHDVLPYFSTQKLNIDTSENPADGTSQKSADKDSSAAVRVLRSSKRNKSLTETSGEQRFSSIQDASRKDKKSHIRSPSKCVDQKDSFKHEDSRLETTFSQETLNLELFIELCGYLLHPGTVVFGPWCSLATYRQLLLPLHWVSLTLTADCCGFDD